MDTSMLGTLSQIAPDLMEDMELRALVLERVAALAPIGRRALATRLHLAEREVRSLDPVTGAYTESTMKDVGFLRLQLVKHKEVEISVDIPEGATEEEIALIKATPKLTAEERAKLTADEKKLALAMAEPMSFEQVYDAHGKPCKGKFKVTGQKPNELLVLKPEGGLFDWIGLGIKCELFPPLIFLGVGALTDFGPLLASPKALLLGAAAQGGVAFTFLAAVCVGFKPVPSALSVERTARPPSSWPVAWHRSCWELLPWPPTPTWPWYR